MPNYRTKSRIYPEIAHATPRAEYPLSFQQQRIWFLSQLRPASPLWNRISAKRLTGKIDLQALERAVDGLVSRHAILGARVNLVQHEPCLVFPASTGAVFHCADLARLEPSRREEAALALLRQESERPIRPGDEPLFQAALVLLGNTDYVLWLKLHHMISDATTFQILWADLKRLYHPGGPSTESPPARPAQYYDYVLWQRDLLEEGRTKEQEAFWLDQFAGPLPVLDLPTDWAPPPAQSFRGACEKLVLDPALTRRLRSFSLKEKVILFSTLLSAYLVLLQKYCQQEDLIVGTVFSGRHYGAQFRDMVGFFVNTVAIRMDLGGDPAFADLLRRVHAKVTDAHAMQDYPFERLIQKVNPDRNSGRPPLFQAAFNVVTSYPERACLEGIEKEAWVEPETVSSQVDLTLHVHDGPEAMEARLEYSTDLFRQETIRRMIEHYGNLLQSIVNEPAARLSQLEMLGRSERQRLLAAACGAANSYPRDRCLHELFEARAEHAPDAVAIVMGDAHLTYREVNRRANQLAHLLRGRGVRPDTRVGLCLERSLDLIVCLLGILKAGGAFLPLDPTYPRERLAATLADARVHLLLTRERWVERFDHAVSRVSLDAQGAEIATEKEENPPHEVESDNLAYVLYTSGSTGKPKGIEIEHRCVLALLHGFEQAAPLDEPPVGISVCPMSFDVAVWEFFSVLCFGGSLHLLLPETFADPRDLTAYLLDCHITSAYVPPGLLSNVADELEKQRRRLPLGRLLVGVEPLEQGLLQRFRDLSPRMHIVNGYGPTETTICATFFKFQEAVEPTRRTPIGTPVPGYDVYLVDAHLEPVPIGVPGEIVVGGPGLGRGYLCQSDLTADKFIPHPFADSAGRRLYRTGDLGRYLPDGNIEFLGRRDHQVKVRGFRVELQEIEAVLCQHPNVREAVVVARDEGTRPAGGKQLAAYVVCGEAPALPAGVLKSFLKERLPDYMVPLAWTLMDALPRTATGKVNRLALPAPQVCQPGYVAPGTPTEIALAAIWAELLGLERVGIHDNFFELGGHSLLAMQAVLRMREAIGADLPMNKILEIPYVAGLANYIEVSNRAKQQLTDISQILVEDRDEGRI